MSLPATIAAMIGEFNELYQGQPASPEVLKSLLKELIAQTKTGNLIVGKPSRAYFWIRVELGEDEEGNRVQLIILEFKGPSRPGGPPTLAVNEYLANEEGLLRAIVDGKDMLKRYYRDGICEGCQSHDRERVKLEGGTHCLQCTMNKAMGL